MILLPNGKSIPLRIHSMVGLVPLFAVFAAVADQDPRASTMFLERAQWFVEHRPDLLKNVAPVLDARRRTITS